MFSVSVSWERVPEHARGTGGEKRFWDCHPPEYCSEYHGKLLLPTRAPERDTAGDGRGKGEMRVIATALCLIMATGLGPVARADDYQGVRSRKILTSTVAANGQKLSYLRTENPEVTAMIVEIPPHGETGWHLHAVPVYAYVLGGKLTVEMEGGKKYDFQEGDAIFEVKDTPHNGRNNGEKAARLVVFYTGEIGAPNVTRVNMPGSQ